MPKINTFGPRPTFLTDFRVLWPLWLQGCNHCPYLRMQQVWRGCGCFPPGQQSLGGFDHPKCLFRTGPWLLIRTPPAFVWKCYINVTLMYVDAAYSEHNVTFEPVVIYQKSVLWISSKTPLGQSLGRGSQRPSVRIPVAIVLFGWKCW